MNQKVTIQRSGGIGMGGALFLLFLGLKLTDNIDWSWWWVTAPLWIPACFAVLLMICAVLIAVLMNRAEKFHHR